MERGVGGGDDYLRDVFSFNISIKGGCLFQGGDYSRDGYYSRKYMYSTFSDKKMGIAKGLDLRVEPFHIKLC